MFCDVWHDMAVIIHTVVFWDTCVLLHGVTFQKTVFLYSCRRFPFGVRSSFSPTKLPTNDCVPIFILFIPCTVDNQMTTLSQTKSITLFPDFYIAICNILYYMYECSTWYCNIDIWKQYSAFGWSECCDFIVFLFVSNNVGMTKAKQGIVLRFSFVPKEWVRAKRA
jgi:hypothetical protein